MSLQRDRDADVGSLAAVKAALDARTRELAEAHDREAATAEVLKAISSTSDLQRVLDTLLETACRLCEADIGTIRYEEGEGYRLAATFGCRPEWHEHFAGYSTKPDRTSVFGKTILDGSTVHIPDVLEDPEYARPVAQKLMGLRAALGVPLVRAGKTFGVISLFRTTPRPFTAKQIALLETFADQAEIAIENARLMSEQREALDRQTATSEVLKVIASSPTDVQPVFDAIAQSAMRLFGGQSTTVTRVVGDEIHLAALTAGGEEGIQAVRSSFPSPLSSNGIHSRVARNGQPAFRFDIENEPDVSASIKELARARGYRSILVVPMLRDGIAIGTIGVTRPEPTNFTVDQIDLLKTFADQAVIAIENVRLFAAEQQRTKELTESLEQQTATSEVLKIISASPGELAPVFDAMLTNATEICKAKFGQMLLLEDGNVNIVAQRNTPAELVAWDDKMGRHPPVPGGPLERLIGSKENVVHIPDVTVENSSAPAAKLGGAKTLLVVAMRKDGALIGAIIIYRQEVRPFSEKQIELVSNFAAQAVIAIENARLLSELRETLERQTATSEVLGVISSSPGELEPVFKTMLENAARICEAKFANLFLYSESENAFRLVANKNAPAAYAERWAKNPALSIAENPNNPLARLAETKRLVDILDLKSEAGYMDRDPRFVALVEAAGARTHILIPMLKEGALVGAIAVYRQEVRAFSDKQIELLTNFAAQAVIAIENTRLLSELRESLAQQTATSEVLKVISSSPGELEPVFQAMLQNATRICEAKIGILWTFEDGAYRAISMLGISPAYAEYLNRGPFRPGPETGLGRVASGQQTVHIVDTLAEQAYADRDPFRIATAELGGARTLLNVPMFKDGKLIGAIGIYRQEVRPFTGKQIELVTNFAAQAVIAIENTRLLSELRESLSQQTATSEVLGVISSSPGDLKPVFESMLANAVRICEAKLGSLFLSEGDGFRTAALYGASPEFIEARQRNPVLKATPGTGLGRVATTKKAVQIADVRQEPAYTGDPSRSSFIDLAGARTVLNVPMLKDNELVGQIGIYRQEVRPFTDRQIELVSNFAAQAVIAIENTRLLSELRQRTDDLTESLEQQTATSEVLKVISSSPGELEPVFSAMLENATRICEAKFGTLLLSEGDGLRAVALHGASPAYAEERKRQPVFRPAPTVPVARAIRTKQVQHVTDLRAEQAYIERDQAIVTMVEAAGARTFLAVPMLNDGEAIGAIIIYRQEVRPFSDKQIELIQNFAAQAVIAIENARLLSELRETLERQTATSEVLKVISSSPGELEPVFNAMLENAVRICGAKCGTLFLSESEDPARAVAQFGATSGYAEDLKQRPVIALGEGALGRCARTKQPVQIADVQADPAYLNDPPRLAIMKLNGARTMFNVPMLKDNEVIGQIAIYRQEVLPFTDKQVELMQNFAAQAVIAIENARLLSELRESLEQQTATSEVLKVIASSTGELAPVFSALLANATRLCEASYGALWLREGDAFRTAALHGGLPQAYLDQWRSGTLFRPSPDVPMARVAATGQPVQVADLRTTQAYRSGDHLAVTGVDDGGIRTVATVPMFKDKELLGVIAIYRTEVRPFADKQIELVKNFAAQAVIAIENARLLSELRESLDQQTATSEVLKVIASSTGELQPVFEAILNNATRLCAAKFGNLYLCEDDAFRSTAMHNVPEAFAEERRRHPLVHPEPGSLLRRLFDTKAAVNISDATKEQAYMEGQPRYVSAVKLGGFRSMLAVPMLKDGALIGAVIVYRQGVSTFSDKQIALVQNFAAQAVIAIENARLLSELRESLEQQTATSEVLEVISSSPGELKPVFQAMLENATRICGATFGNLVMYEGEHFRRVAVYNPPPALAEDWQRSSIIDPDKSASLREIAAHKQVIHILDLGAVAPNDPIHTLAGARTFLAVPLLKDNELVGVIGIYRQVVQPFNDKQIELLTNFAAQAVIAIENTRLLNELRQRTDDLTESLQQQTATSEILEVISNSPTDTQPAFDAIVRSGLRLFPDAAIVISLPEGDTVNLGAIAVADAADKAALQSRYPMPLSREYITGTALLDRREMDIADARDTPVQLIPGGKNFLASGYRAITVMPMMRGEATIGALSVARREPGALSDKQKELLRTFAAQAVIAIENTRLFNELRQRTDDLSESLEQQTATSEVLKVISSSPGELEPVFQAMLANATRICGAAFGSMLLAEGDLFRRVAQHNAPPKFAEFHNKTPIVDPQKIRDLKRLVETKQVIHIADVAAENPDDPIAINAGARTLLIVPMLKENDLIGTIGIYRQEVRPFTDKQIALLTSFAAQAVIAIENARLLKELRERTDDLTESLQQQTATADVLAVMSRSQFDLAPILQSVVDTAARLCRAEKAVIFRLDGGLYRFAAGYSLDPKYIEIEKAALIAPGPGTAVGRAAMDKQVVRIDDAFSDPHYAAKDDAKIGDVRSMIGVPLMREGEPIGVIALARSRVEPFNEREIELVTTFADQAVIAIENVRLFEEVQARTEDLSESLQQQIATADVLKLISRSTFDLQPVLDTLVESATRLCAADKGTIFLRDGDVFRLRANQGFSGEAEEYARENPMQANRGSATGRVVLDNKAVHIPDVLADPEYTVSGYQKTFGYRTILSVPLLREGMAIGVFSLTRDEVNPFSENQIELVTTFADQAVIAIENVRLFDEVQARTEDLSESLQQQTATADVLKVISRSTFDLQTVLNTLIESAARLCRADRVALRLLRDGAYHAVALHGYPPEHDVYMKSHPTTADPSSLSGRAVLAAKPVQVEDITKNPELTLVRASPGSEVIRTLLAVPLLREGAPIGVLVLSRERVELFTEKQIELVTTFADQAVIAIENVRLFDEIQDKSRQLEEASKHKSQFLANMSHELRTPLNAILGYTELIADGVYGDTPEKVQVTLKRVITNGKHLLGLINDVLDLSKIEAGQLTLSLTDYSMKDVVHNVYGAVEPLASEKKLAFKVEIAPDMAAGHGDERRLTQVLLNLVGNAIKFTDEGQVVIKASQNNGAFSVAVCDTGPGISEDDQKKLFKEFQQADSSTTKKKGGTGLGLAISKKIIEMHGGSIWLESQVGKGSTFAFTVPTRAEQAKRQA